MRTSSVKRLPPEIRELIGQLRGDGRTIDEILAKLHELKQDVSRTALGRHINKLDKVSEHLSSSRKFAEALVSRLGEGAEDKTARLNIELMNALIFKLLVTEEGQVVELDGKSAFFLAMTLKNLASASKADADREKVIREALKKEAKAKIDNIVKDMTAAEAAGKPISGDTILTKIRNVYGIEA